MGHCRVDVVPNYVIRTPHKPDPIVAQKNDVAVHVATKYHPFVVGTRPTLLLGGFSPVLLKRRSPSLRDRESFSGPCPFGDAGTVALHNVSGTPEVIQLSVLTPTGGNGEH